MKKYEALFIIEPDAASERFDKVKNEISDNIERVKGVVGECEELGQRQLCYDIRHNKEGFYYLVKFTVEPNVINEVRDRYELSKDILRFLISSVE
ncbi:30S ribosomal protein S6 [bacterium]|nr:30S ribosomal protein S6 [bacterium]